MYALLEVKFLKQSIVYLNDHKVYEFKYIHPVFILKNGLYPSNN